MTDRIDTAALRRAREETTQGEWRITGVMTGHKGDVFTPTAERITDCHHIARCYAPKPEKNPACSLQVMQQTREAIAIIEANARFIALAHREWPALLDEIDRLRGLTKANNDLARMEAAHRKRIAFQRAELANAMEALTSQYGHRLPAEFLLALTQMLMRHGDGETMPPPPEQEQ